MRHTTPSRILTFLAAAGGLAAAAVSAAPPAPSGDRLPHWEWCGWGGGGAFYSTVFHPRRDGVIYVGQDVNGVCKTTDHGLTWTFVNRGLANYEVPSLAVDPSSPDTIYAATRGGLCKSEDGGEHWRLLPRTGPKELRITGEKERSIRAVAVDPRDGRNVYAATPAGKIFKSADGGETWKQVYEASAGADDPGSLRVQFGKKGGALFGGVFLHFSFPAGADPKACNGIGFTFQGDGSAPPKSFFLDLATADGTYRSRNLNELFKNTARTDVVLAATDFTVDAEKFPNAPARPDWATVKRLDIGCTGPLANTAFAGNVSRIYFSVGKTPEKILVRDFAQEQTRRDPKAVSGTYGNVQVGKPVPGPVYSIAVSPKNPSLVAAATHDTGLILSTDAGATWRPLPTPKTASNVAFDPTDEAVLYGAFFAEGMRKSTDKGKTWSDISRGLVAGRQQTPAAILDFAVNPRNPQELVAIGNANWHAMFYKSKDGGASWEANGTLKYDRDANPTLPDDPPNGIGGHTVLKNVAINPGNPDELFMCGNWRNAWSGDGGRTWEERDRGADMSCIHDIQFHKGKTYVSAMDEGSLVSEDNGKHWKALWPARYKEDFSGHNWRIRVLPLDNGGDRIIGTNSPWLTQYPSCVVISDDGGRTYRAAATGLPDYTVTANTMWGRGYPRALAVDPNHPNVLYLGIDGDPTPGKPGGGIFKSEDAGLTWKQLPNQPGSRRMFYGLAVDPTNSQRLFWGAAGGVWRSEDGGASWKKVHTDGCTFNLMINARGDVYAGGQNLWRSTDHGATWKPLTNFTDERLSVVGIAGDPRNPDVLWISRTIWNFDIAGGIYKSTDGGATWTEITGDIPHPGVLILRYNPDTRELWAGGVGLYKLKP